MIGNAKIGVALVGGYLLGRTRKAKMAIGLGMFLAGRKLNLDPKQLARAVADSPVLSGLGDQARREVVDATKTAATKALTQRANSLADSLHGRTLDLGGGEDRPETGGARGEEEPEPARRTTSAGAGSAARKPAKPAGKAAKKTAGATSKAPSRTAAASSGTRRPRRKAASGGNGGDDG